MKWILLIAKNRKFWFLLVLTVLSAIIPMVPSLFPQMTTIEHVAITTAVGALVAFLGIRLQYPVK